MTAEPPLSCRLYLDEDVHRRVAAALRLRHFDVVSAHEVQRWGLTDEEQLRYAAAEGRTLFTYNAADYVRLHLEWQRSEQQHHGIVFSEPGPATVRTGIGIGPMDEDANEENNTAELVFTVQPAAAQPLPDLLISRVSLDPSSPRVGEEVEVEVEITNAGTANAGRHTVTWKSDPETIGCSWRVDGVPAGMSIIKRCTYIYTYPQSGQSTYTKADANGDVEELDEDNNVRYLRVNVRPAS